MTDPLNSLTSRFPLQVDPETFEYHDDLAQLGVDDITIAKRVRADIRQMAPVRFQACFRRVLNTIQSRTASDHVYNPDTDPEALPQDATTRYYLIGTQLDTATIPASPEQRAALYEREPTVLDAEIGFITQTNEDGTLTVEVLADDPTKFDYGVLACTYGGTLPRFGDTSELSLNNFREYLDHTLETRASLLESDRELYNTYEKIIGACLETYADNR